MKHLLLIVIIISTSLCQYTCAQTIIKPKLNEFESLLLPAESFLNKNDTVSAEHHIKEVEKKVLKKYKRNKLKKYEWYTYKAEFYAFQLKKYSDACDMQMKACQMVEKSKYKNKFCESFLKLTDYELLNGEYNLAYASALLALGIANFTKERTSILTIDSFEKYIISCILIGKNKEALLASQHLQKMAEKEKNSDLNKGSFSSYNFYSYQRCLDLKILCDLSLGYTDEASAELKNIDNLAKETNKRLKFKWENIDKSEYCNLSRTTLLYYTNRLNEAIKYANTRPEYLRLPWNMIQALEEAQIHIILSKCYLKQNKLDNSLDELNKAYSFIKECNETHPMLAKILSIYAEIINRKGYEIESINLLGYAKYVLSKCDFKVSLQRSNLIQQIIKYSLDIDETKKYWNSWVLESTALKLKSLREEFAISDSNERLHIWSKSSYRDWFENTLPSLVIDYPENYSNDTILGCAYSGIQTYKSLLLHSEIRIKQQIEKLNNPKITIEYNNYKELKNKLLQAGVDNFSKSDSIQQAIYALDNKILRELELCDDTLYNNAMKIDDNYLSKIKKENVYIDFVKYRNKNNIDCYGAFIALRWDERSGVVPLHLCEAGEIDTISIDKMFTNSKLYDIIWGKIEIALKKLKAQNVIFSAAGALHSLPIEYALDEQYTPFSDKFNVYRVLSTKEAIINQTDKCNTKYNKISVWGSMDYTNHKNGSKDCVPKNLPYSKLEINSIKQQAKGKIYADVFEQKEANENNFKNYDFRKTDIIHIASHGFYLTDEYKDINRRKFDANSRTKNKKGMLSTEDKSLMKSVLLFSIPTGSEFLYDDGVLTATEISMLNLYDVDLAVLSACQTGLGDVSSEGNIGLQRAFKKAGVHTQLISLKNVYDKSTFILMKEFYRNLFDGHSKRESLRNAQHYLKKTSNGKYKDPKYWAPFILIDAI